MKSNNMEGGETIAERMSFIVKAAGGIKAAAQRMDVTEPALRSVVKGERNPGWKIIGSLADMGIDLNWFVCGAAMENAGGGDGTQAMVKKLTDRLLESERVRIEQELEIAQLRAELKQANAHVEKGRAYEAISNSIKKK